jgi:hypothetical protein
VKPYTADDVRLEGWWFMLGGGAGVINLNGEFHRGQEAGGADSRERILPERRVLKQFLDRLDLSRMARYEGVRTDVEDLRAAAIADPGRTYAVYLFRAKDDGQWGAHFVAAPFPFAYRGLLRLADIPAGTWRASWIDPASGREIVHGNIEAPGGELTLTIAAAFRLDLALLLERQQP